MMIKLSTVAWVFVVVAVFGAGSLFGRYRLGEPENKLASNLSSKKADSKSIVPHLSAIASVNKASEEDFVSVKEASPGRARAFLFGSTPRTVTSSIAISLIVLGIAAAVTAASCTA
jgi:hypothetical protein